MCLFGISDHLVNGPNCSFINEKQWWDWDFLLIHPNKQSFPHLPPPQECACTDVIQSTEVRQERLGMRFLHELGVKKMQLFVGPTGSKLEILEQGLISKKN